MLTLSPSFYNYFSDRFGYKEKDFIYYLGSTLRNFCFGIFKKLKVGKPSKHSPKNSRGSPLSDISGPDDSTDPIGKLSTKTDADPKIYLSKDSTTPKKAKKNYYNPGFPKVFAHDRHHMVQKPGLNWEYFQKFTDESCRGG